MSPECYGDGSGSGEGVATIKFDGTCCMIKDGKFFRRFELKKGKVAPDDFCASQEADPVTGDCPGWIPVDPKKSQDIWHVQAYENDPHYPCIPDGTYELMGPKIQGNPENLDKHVLILHGDDEIESPRTFSGLKDFMKTYSHEGIVWHHQDGRMVKIKKKDFENDT